MEHDIRQVQQELRDAEERGDAGLALVLREKLSTLADAGQTVAQKSSKRGGKDVS